MVWWFPVPPSAVGAFFSFLSDFFGRRGYAVKTEFLEGACRGRCIYVCLAKRQPIGRAWRCSLVPLSPIRRGAYDWSAEDDLKLSENPKLNYHHAQKENNSVSIFRTRLPYRDAAHHEKFLLLIRYDIIEKLKCLNSPWSVVVVIFSWPLGESELCVWTICNKTTS